MRETLKNVVCPTCVHDKVASLFSKYKGKPLSQIKSLAPVLGSSQNLSPGCSSNHVIARSPPLNLNLTNTAIAYQLNEYVQMEKALMKDIAASAMKN
ncbi:hypothetical protein DVH24_035440 [Malus domestica]|uniref:Uncharacterized protein n=1 Tax=Malus domestica TaxID=3750 RepID=A0A498J656_MALDO|nr:hypothetical protein DVH24_035440 [Malus domestica]